MFRLTARFKSIPKMPAARTNGQTFAAVSTQVCTVAARASDWDCTTPADERMSDRRYRIPARHTAASIAASGHPVSARAHVVSASRQNASSEPLA